MNRLETIRRLHIQKLRFRYGRKSLMWKLSNISSNNELSSIEQEEINSVWKNYDVDKRWFSMYKTCHNGEFDSRYIPDDIYYAFFTTTLANPLRAKHIDDKNLYDLLFFDVRQPKTIVRKMRHGYQDANYNILSEQQAIEMLEGRSFIIKQSIDSEDGNGVTIFRTSQTATAIHCVFSEYKEFITQELIIQHPILSSLHPESINTLRLITFFDGNYVKVLSAVVRMGCGDAMIDSSGQGGIFCGINEDGRLKPQAFDVYGRKYDKHPDGAIFQNHVIPNYSECKELVCKLAARLVGIGRIMSWDIAISEDSHPILIEVNMSYGEIDYHQLTNGPLFGDDTSKVINEVFSNKQNRILNKVFNKIL